MVDMAKLKEQALQRKQQHEENELKKQLNKGKKPKGSSASSARRGSATRNASAQRALAKQPPQKRKRSVSRWIVDILLFLGALLIMVMMINPFG